MQQHITQWLGFFQVLLLTRFRQNQKEAIKTLIWLIVGHLFGLYNPNQLAEAMGIAKANLYRHLSQIVLHEQLQERQWECPKPVARIKAHSPTFGDLILLFFEDQDKCCCMMVFGRPLRAAEILSIWRQHHGIEQFWRSLKSIVHLSAMSLHRPSGTYATLGVKVNAYLLLLAVSMATRQTPHQIQLKLSGQIHLLVELMEHFQPGG